jgi:hypothetical protein
MEVQGDWLRYLTLFSAHLIKYVAITRPCINPREDLVTREALFQRACAALSDGG